VEFEDALRELGFKPTDDRRTTPGSRTYVAHANRFLTYSVHAYADGTALLSFEFAIAAYLWDLGLQIGSHEELNQFLYPRTDLRGPQDAAWLAGAIDQVEALLGSVDLADPDPAGDAVGPDLGEHRR
jgi:hypothetical protein